MQGSALVDDLANFAVELTVPLRSRHAMTVRTVVASVAADLGLDVDEIDDLRLAVSEVFTILVEAVRDAAGEAASEATRDSASGAAPDSATGVPSDSATGVPSDSANDVTSDRSSEPRCEMRLEVVDGDSFPSMTVTLLSSALASATSTGTVELDSLAMSILRSVVDEHDLVRGGIVIRKRRARPDDAAAFDRSI